MFRISTVSSLITKCKNDYFIAESVSSNIFAGHFEHVQKQLYKMTSKKKEYSLTLTEDTYAYDLPSDCQEVEAVWWNDTPLRLVSLEWLDENDENWRDTDNSGTPLYYAVDKGMGKIYITPAPDSDAITTASTATLKYIYKSTALPTDGTGSVSTPTEWDDIYIHYALWQIAENYRDFATATRRSSMYHGRLREIADDEAEDQTGYVGTVDVYSHTNWRHTG